MIKRLFIFGFLFTCLLNTTAQQYGNEWINYSQTYYKLPIPKTGLYRIDSLTLSNSGVPLSLINPKNLQLFIKGQEQFIYVKGESDGIFNSSDYIEFYAEKNNGITDSSAYMNITRLPNPYYALFNDTNYAFLSWNTSLINNRVSLETDTTFSSYTPANYFYSEKVHTSNSYYSVGKKFFEGINDPRYVKGEGYGFALSKGQIIQTTFGNLNVYQSPSLPCIIRTSYSGASEVYLTNGFDHEISLSYLDNNGSYATLDNTTFQGYEQYFIERTITSDKLQNSSHINVTSVNNPLFSNINNLSNVHYTYLKYPELPDFLGVSEKTFFVDDNTSGAKTYINLQNVNTSGGSIILYDLSNHKYVTNVSSGSNVKALIPNSGNQKKCFLTTSNNVTMVNSLLPVNQTGYFINYKTTNPDSAFVIVSHKGLQSAANDYKIYRQSPAGGSNHVVLAMMEDLYDQFAYGNTKNPLSIRNLCRYLSDSLVTPPKYLLLLGKSIHNNLLRTNPIYWNACDVPTIGYPSSDNLFTYGIHGANNATPFIPTGRVSARTNAQAGYYLDKVEAHENGLQNHEDWHKRVLHFAGGTDAGQQFLFQYYLKNYEDTIKAPLFGGTVFNFYKTTSAPIQITVSDSIKQLINYGAGIMTFFGHAAINTFDQAIDDPSVYSNKDKYPLFIANSCYSGDVHTLGSNSTSEAFTLIEEKGSIGFIASAAVGLVPTLNNFSSKLYKSLAYDTYHKGIGDAVKNTCYKNSLMFDQLQEITDLDMILEGDPSIRINAFEKPDYEIKNEYVFFNTTNYVDSIGVNVIVKNNGKAIVDTFKVRVEHAFPSGDTATYYREMKAPYNKDTLTFYVLKDLTKCVGLNNFKVTIDAYNEISELSETNNTTSGTVDLFIPGGDVIPIFPYKYAIIPNTATVTLKASTADPFIPSASFKIQLDTNDTFSNPINSTIVTSSGGVVEWTVNLPYADSTVYFWRISKDSVLPTDRFHWRESSFQVIGTKTGWSQAHFHQFKNDNYQFVKYKKATRNFVFENDNSSIMCRNGYYSAIPWTQINYSINGSVMHLLSCALNGWEIAIFDSISAKPHQSISDNYPNVGHGIYGNCHCYGNRPLNAFDFGSNTPFCSPTTTPAWQTDLENALNSLPNGTKILAYSTQNHQSSTFSNSLYTAFESFGSANIRTVADSVPIIIFGKKGSNIGQAQEVIGATHNSIITLSDTLKSNWNNGFIASEIIGPATQWRSLHWRQTTVESPTNDTIILKLVGIKANGQRDTLVAFPKDSSDVYNLSSYINASIYPQLQLVALMSDPVTLSPPQLKKWQVIYDEVPECAINPKKGFYVKNDTISEGDNLVIHLPIENVGTLPFTDSLLVTYWVEDVNSIPHQLPQKLKAKPFVPAQVIIDTINFNSYQYPGLNYLWVDINPPGEAKYQTEQHHFNNIARIPFGVTSDKINPLLDVTFDGTHILNGDIVSAKPHVLVTLKDENKFLALNDTSNFAIWIRYPNQSSDKRLYFSNNLQFTSAQLPNNSCKIEWKPELTSDGKYTLLVQATDRSKNASGSIDYNIQFEIDNTESVTEVLNYPNPFSTSTRFVFTLTGSEIPDIFTIQIMTITGKVVREIKKEELGNIRIGRNITQYAWDGKDEFGDKLGNGVYLYRVITRHNGESLEKRESEADSFFKKGIGKMVIMR